MKYPRQNPMRFLALLTLALGTGYLGPGASRAATADQVNQALEQTAISLARALDQPEMREQLRQEVGKRFDGDLEALYVNLATRPLADGESFHRRLATVHGERLAATRGVALKGRDAARRALERHIRTIPKFQVAVPVGFDTWDTASYAPLVAYLPAGVDDHDLTFLRAFDAWGELHLVDAWNPPPEPLVVLGINERIGDDGELLYFLGREQLLALLSPAGVVDKALPQRQNGTLEFLQLLKINDIHEPSSKGKPEIRLLVAGENFNRIVERNEAIAFDLKRSDEGDWLLLNRSLFTWNGDMGTMAMFFWFEGDSGSSKKTHHVTSGSRSFFFKIRKKDDLLGHFPVQITDPQVTTAQPYTSTLNDAEWVDSWQGPQPSEGSGESL